MDTRLLRLLRYKLKLTVAEIGKHERVLVKLRLQLEQTRAEFAAEQARWDAERAAKAALPKPVPTGVAKTDSDYARKRAYRRREREIPAPRVVPDCRERRLGAEARVAELRLRAISHRVAEDEPIG